MGFFSSSDKVEAPKFPHKVVSAIDFFGYFDNHLNGQLNMVKEDVFQCFIMPFVTDASYKRMCKLVELYEKEFSDSALESMNEIYSDAVKDIKANTSDYLQLIANRDHYMGVSKNLETLLAFFFSDYNHISNRVGFELDFNNEYTGKHHHCAFKDYLNYDKHWAISRRLNDLAENHNYYLFHKKMK